MGELGKAIEGLNIPKQLIDKGEKVIKALFGPSIKEMAGTLGDSFRFRRFKNQVKILEKAEKYLEKKKMSPKKLDLKVLVPLLEYTSLEENPSLQETWAKLISNLVTVKSNSIIKKRAVEAMSKLSNEDILIMNILYEQLDHYSFRYKYYIKDLKGKVNITEMYDSMKDDYCSTWELKEYFKSQNHNSELELFNLVDLGILDYKKTVNISKRTTSYFNEGVEAITKSNFKDSFDVEFEQNKSVKFTRFGIEFIALCRDKSFLEK